MFDPDGPTFFELAEQALSSTRRGYDLLAPKFEHTPFRTPDDLVQPVAEYLGAPGSLECALDVCCGTGAGMRMLRPLCRDHVTGIDFSEGMLAEARRQVKDAPGSAELRFVQGDVLDMPWEGVFDAATCFGALGHFVGGDQDRLVASVHKALKPGGRFAFVTGERPTPLHPIWWAARGFNFAMHVRNAVLSPPFVMFYLTFMLPEVKGLLERYGFEVDVHAPYDDHPRARLVVATKV